MKKINIYTDGGSRGNPGPAALGVLLVNEKGQPIKKYSKYLGERTNNEAEYQAVIFALEKFKQLFGKKLASQSELEIRSDSELVVKQLNSKYKILEPKLQPLFLKVWNLKFDFQKVRFKLISRTNNQEADHLVNEALDQEMKKKKLL